MAQSEGPTGGPPGGEGHADPGSSGGGSLTVVGSADSEAWASVLADLADYDFYHFAGYHRLAERRGDGTAALFVYRESRYVIALPLLVRPVGVDGAAGLQDATSVYGYAGPVASHKRVPKEIVGAFHAVLCEELVRRRVVSVFSRLHPLIEQDELIAGLGEIRPMGLTVSVDLTLPPEDQWAGYSKKCRRIIRRAQEHGVVCFEDVDGTYRRDWTQMYRETMQRVGASSSYHFDDDYFELLAAELGPVLRLFVARVDGRTAAAGLYTICNGIVQAHLGASRQEYSMISPVRLLDDTARRWASDAGARVFHLGGGVGGQQDSLFQYKAGFSDRRHEFATWQWIVDPTAYRELCLRRGLRGSPETSARHETFFPAYRRATDP